MKKLFPTALFIVIIIVVASSSCHKDDNIQKHVAENKKYPVSFTMSGFNRTVSAIGSQLTAAQSQSISGDSLRDLLSAIGCLIVNRNNPSEKYKLWQLSSNNTTPFGTFSDSLSYGSYAAYFAAVGKGADLANDRHDPGFPPGLAIFGQLPDLAFGVRTGLDYFSISNSDAFIADSINFEINGTTDNSNLAVNMHRIVGLLIVDIRDATPGLNFRIRMDSLLMGGAYHFSRSKYDPLEPNTVPQLSSIYFNKLSPNVFQIYVPNVDNYFSITIEQLSMTDNSVIKTKTINNIICAQNKVTTLSGNFFSGGGSSNLGSSFNININPSWSTDTTKINF